MYQKQASDITKLKYALYIRKSTDDAKNQVRSTEDQLAECRELVKQLKINVVGDPIIEKKSAKIPGLRPKFKQLLKDVKAGKYSGIVSWHPDRLARNMLEGGKIIDLLDKEVLKDLRFVTHHFTNDATGKMLLGISFVLSKLYTDNLSNNVTRGIQGNLKDGIGLHRKHGYAKDEETGRFIPDVDNDNFQLVGDAWQLRKEGASLESIAEYMNSKGYGKLIKSSGKEVIMGKKKLSLIFKDTLYYGVLVQGGESVDLRTRPGYGFEPLVSEEDFFEVQKLSNTRKQPYKKQKQANYNPFRQLIKCSYCGKHMLIAPSSGNKYKYLFARCDNKLCVRNSEENKKKDRNDPTKIKVSVRVKVVLDFIYNLLDNGLNFSEADYSEYLKNFKILSEKQKTEITQEIHIKRGLLSRVSAEVKDLSLSYMKLDKSKETIKKVTEEKITELEEQQSLLESGIRKLKEKIANPESEQLTIEEFLNLSKNAGTVVKSANAIIKDKICRFIFLNLSIDGEKVVSFRLREPFETLMNVKKKTIRTNGELERTRTSDLYNVNVAL